MPLPAENVDVFKMKTNIIFRKAKISDAVKIKKMIDSYAKDGFMLFRSIYEIYGNIRDFFIAEKEKKVIGCCALHVLGKEYRPGLQGSILAELRSLAVLGQYHGQGTGTRLVEECVNEAKRMEIDKLFALTARKNVNFFKNWDLQKPENRNCPKKSGKNASIVQDSPRIATRSL